MGVRASRLILATLISVTAISCGSDPLSPATRAQIWLAQDRWLTIDGNVRADVIGRFLSRMRAGGLDAAVFMVPYGDAQGTIARVRDIKAALEEDAARGGLALSSQDANRFQIEKRRTVNLGVEVTSISIRTIRRRSSNG